MKRRILVRIVLVLILLLALYPLTKFVILHDHRRVRL